MTDLPHPPAPSPQAARGCEHASGQSWYTDAALWEKLKPLAQQMRRASTEAEDRLWQRLRNRQMLDLKFRRQHTIERFIVDFYCAEAHLVIEVDGPIHDYTPVEDAIRQEFLQSQGLQVIRFTNAQILNSLDMVLATIVSTCQARVDSPSLLAERGRGGEVNHEP